MGKAVTLPEHIVDLVNLPLTPTRRQAGAHRRHAGWLERFELGIALGVVAHETAGLMREVVDGSDEGVEALADVGCVKGFSRIFAAMVEVGRKVEAAFPDGLCVPDGFRIEVLERVEKFERARVSWRLAALATPTPTLRGRESAPFAAGGGGCRWFQAMRGNHDQAADAGFCGAQDEHDYREGGAWQEEQAAPDAHACKRK